MNNKLVLCNPDTINSELLQEIFELQHLLYIVYNKWMQDEDPYELKELRIRVDNKLKDWPHS